MPRTFQRLAVGIFGKHQRPTDEQWQLGCWLRLIVVIGSLDTCPTQSILRCQYIFGIFFLALK